MTLFKPVRVLHAPIVILLAIGLAACGQSEPPATNAAEDAAAATAATATKIPITTSSEEARASLLEGRTLLDNLRRTESRAKFEQAVKHDPSFATGYVFLAVSAPSAADFFDAIGKAVAYAEGASEGEQLVIRALSSGARNDQDAQLEALNALVALHPKDERSHMRLANFYNGQADFESASVHFGHAVAINPQMPAAYNSLGYAKRFNDDLDGAKAAFEKYIELIPDEANPYDSYAELLMEMGDYDESIKGYQKALEIDSDFPSAYAGISINQSLKGNVDAALAAAADMLAVARSPGEQQAAIFNSITAHLFAGNTEAALAASDEMMAVAVGDGNHAAMGGISEYRGDMLLVADKTEEALAAYTESLAHRRQADINDANKAQAERTYLFKSALTAMVANDIESSQATAAKYRAAVEANGTLFERRRVHELTGYLAMEDEDKSIAVAELAQASQINPIVLYWSAVANKNAGNADAARDLADRAANRNTLSGNLPFFRQQALQLLEELSES